MKDIVLVAVGVIKSGDQFFLTKRSSDVHQGGKWEFPGGKVESEETVPEALHRELQEEVDIDVLSCMALCEIDHDYGDKRVRLEVFLIDNFTGEPSSQEGLMEGWFDLKELNSLEFPKANARILEKLNVLYSL